MTYYNYRGIAMPESQPETGRIVGTAAGDETVQAPDGHTSVSGEGGGDLLLGSSGDNRIWHTDPHDRVIEQPNGGIDTEIGWMTIRAAPNVENLIVHQDFNHAVGNSLGNLIIVDGRQWVAGLGGDDVLVGSTNTTTTFVVRAGEGNDVIYNWQGADQLQLVGYNFGSPAQVRAAMTQQGSDVVLRLSSTETLTFRDINLTTTPFLDHQFLLPLDRAKLGALTFSDEFDTLSLWDHSHQTGKWSVDFGGNVKDAWAYTLPSNGEAQVYVHEGFEGLGEHDLHINPFSVANGVVTITARPIPPADQPAAFDRTYASGMLNTLESFQQKYGYFEMRAEVPHVAGTWPAFWMIPRPYKSQTEADIMESLGATPSYDYRRAWGADVNMYDNLLKVEPDGMHTYGMLWTPERVSFYFDGVEVMHGNTPPHWTEPMGMIVNLAVGGWGGPANPADYPASLKIDYIRAYGLADGSTIVKTATPPAPTATLQNKAGPTGGLVAVQPTFDDIGAPVSSGQIVRLSQPPSAANIPAQGRAFVMWESSGAVYGAESNDGFLDEPTVIAVGSIAQFTGAGSFLTDGRVVVAYTGPDAGQQSAWALLFDPATRTFTRHELGPSTGQVKFVPFEDGAFAASWQTGDGVDARAYNGFSYGGEPPGWWGPVRDLAGEATGVTAQGDLIANGPGGQYLYSVVPYNLSSVGSVSVGPAQISHPEGNSGLTNYTFTITRADQFWQGATVAWKVAGSGANPASAADFAGGVLPSGVASFPINLKSVDVTIQVRGDATIEPQEQFQIQLLNPVGTAIGTGAAIGVIANDDNGTGGGEPPPPPGQVLTSNAPGTVLTGGAGDDTLNASQASDTLTGGGGSDRFVVRSEPWSPIHITDFTIGADKLDLSAMLLNAGYAGSDPVRDRYIAFVSDGAGGTALTFDRDAAGPNPQWPNYIIDLERVSPTNLIWAQLQGGGLPPPGAQIALTTASVSHSEGNSGTTAFSFAVARTGDASGAATVNWSVAGSGANPASASDFQGGALPTGTLSFAAGETAKTVVVNVAGDAAAEPDEGFTVTLSGVSGASLGTASAAGLIANDDGTPPPSGGQVLTSTQIGSVLVGGSGDDTLNASRADDTLTGGGGSDRFVFALEPWSPIHVTDFTPAADKLDLTGMFDSVGYAGTDPVADKYLRFADDGAGGVYVFFDPDGAAPAHQWPDYVIHLDNLAASQIKSSDWIF